MMQSAGAGESPLDWVQQQIAKWQVLVRDGVMDQAQYDDKVRHLQNQQRVGEAGVGMTITECAPYKVLELTPRGPAYKSGFALYKPPGHASCCCSITAELHPHAVRMGTMESHCSTAQA